MKIKKQIVAFINSLETKLGEYIAIGVIFSRIKTSSFKDLFDGVEKSMKLLINENQYYKFFV